MKAQSLSGSAKYLGHTVHINLKTSLKVLTYTTLFPKSHHIIKNIRPLKNKPKEQLLFELECGNELYFSL